MIASTRPTLVVIAGSNGAGKSTLSATLRDPAGIPVLDPDAIARHLRPDAPEQAATQAAREVLRLQRQYVAQGQSFAVETTLAGAAILRLMDDARRQGFTVHVLYIGMEEVQTAIDRIAGRVARGGHHIPDEDVRRRYGRSLRHLGAAMERADRVMLVDNTAEQGPREVLTIDYGQITMHTTDIPRWVSAALGDMISRGGAVDGDEG